MRKTWFAPLVLLTACTAGKSSDTGTGDDTGTGTVAYVQPEAIGDFACYPTGGTTWLTQSPDPALQTSLALTEEIKDFDKGVPVSDAKVEIWFADKATGAADTSGTSDSNGMTTVTQPVCTPTAYRTSTDPARQQTKDTYKAHMVYAPSAVDATDLSYDSVSVETYSIIPSILGLSPDPAKGTIAGRSFDCGEGHVQHAQVTVVDKDGNAPSGMTIKYFVDSFPNRDQPDTSEDGLWVAVNVPPGDWIVQQWTVNGGSRVQSGQTTVTVVADSINVGNIFTGYDSVRYPPECLFTE